MIFRSAYETPGAIRSMVFIVLARLAKQKELRAGGNQLETFQRLGVSCLIQRRHQQPLGLRLCKFVIRV